MIVNRRIEELVQHLERFTRGELDEVLDELQDYLSLYGPEGGPYLYNKDEMDQFCHRILPILKKRI